jgi:lytic murein transglycosylase
MPVRSFRWAIAGVAMGLSLAACESTKVAGHTPAPAPGSPSSPPSPGTGETPPAMTAFGFASSGNTTFDAWRDQFAAKAETIGQKDTIVRSVLEGLLPVEETVQVQSFDNQAEFVKPIWDYATTAVNATRIANGQAKLSANQTIFDAVETNYATPREIVAAIWGMESAYGANIGKDDAPRVLASQAATGRRKDFNEGELLAIMKLIDNGAATRDQFRKASYAGALGQTQFMPSTMLAHGQDYDGDGLEDLWTNSGDALASAANYLTKMGWKKGQPWAVETELPEGFDYAMGDGRKLTVGAWKAVGLTPLMPPTFVDTDVLNAGRPDLSRPWPTGLTMLTQQQAKDLQTGLNKLGYSAGAVDGIIGRGTRGALQKFQKAKGLVADGFPTADMLTIVTTAANEI